MRGILAWPGHTWIALPMRLYLGFVFLYACMHKIADPSAFALDVATYQVLPLSLVNLAALILPWVELLAGIMIVVGFRTRTAALLIAGMMVVFMVALAWALHQGYDMSCGCFASASDEDPISGRTLLRDSGWLALALYVLVFDRRRGLSLDRWLARRPGRAVQGNGAAGGRP
jgi:putative oxidoreductase